MMKLINRAAALGLATSCLLVPSLLWAKPTVAPAVQMSSIQQTVNINQADAAGLATVSGLGPAKAKAIVAFREQNGKFKSLDDLTQVPGIGTKLLAKIKSQLKV